MVMVFTPSRDLFQSYPHGPLTRALKDDNCFLSAAKDSTTEHPDIERPLHSSKKPHNWTL
jgi:hypothetical protein